MGLLEPGGRPRAADGLHAPGGGPGLTGRPAGRPPATIRRIRPDEGRVLREIRLRAVVDAPYAFSGTLATTGAHPPAVWEGRARRAAEGDEEIVVLAETAGGVVGMAGALVREDHPGSRQVHGVWVDPDHRRSGIGDALVASIVAWAREAGAGSVDLWVAEGNGPAERLYRRHGFEPTGEGRPFPPDPQILEREYRLTIGGQSSRSSTV